MDLVTLPQSLFITYGAVVLACGATLGVLVGRHWKRRASPLPPEPPELLQRRVELLEEELDLTRRELTRLSDERDFMRELRPPRKSSAAA